MSQSTFSIVRATWLLREASNASSKVALFNKSYLPMMSDTHKERDLQRKPVCHNMPSYDKQVFLCAESGY